MSKVKYVSLIIIQFVIILTLVININKPKEIKDNDNLEIVKKSHDTISMMLEIEAGSGNYEMTTKDSWPTEGYIFNNDLSKCDHGSELSWDDTNKAVVMTGNISDKCYVYFDKLLEFTVAGTTYHAAPGMTWQEFVNSSYSYNNFNIEYGLAVDADHTLDVIIYKYNNAVALNANDTIPLDASTMIISGYDYQLI